MNKVIAAFMMALTIAMPAAAANNPKSHGSTREKVEAPATNHKDKHNDKADKGMPHMETSHHDAQKGHAYRPDVKTCTIRLSRHDSHKMVEAKAERLPGVMNTSWNPRTRELTVRYDAHVTSSHYIKHHIA